MVDPVEVCVVEVDVAVEDVFVSVLVLLVYVSVRDVELVDDTVDVLVLVAVSICRRLSGCEAGSLSKLISMASNTC